MGIDSEFLSPSDVRALTGMSLDALAQLRHRGRGPRFYKPTERTVLYRRSEVISWVESSAHISTREFA